MIKKMEEEYDAIKEMIRQVEESNKQKYNDMVIKKSWEEFRNTGLLLFINSILHAFGWSIVFETNTETGEVVSVYPARVKFRGFEGEDTSDSHAKIANYLKGNIDDLVEEANS